MAKDFRCTIADTEVCHNCVNEFKHHEDCLKCSTDAHARIAQHTWWKGNPHLTFMGVNVGQALSHSVRGYVLGTLRVGS